MSAPLFIDNLEGNTLAQALGEALAGGQSGSAFAEPAPPPDEVRIATAFFSPSGFAHIADRLTPVATVRLMLGADLAAHTPPERRRLGEAESGFESRRMQIGLKRMAEVLQWERDRLPFTRASNAALLMLIAALKAGNMEVRRYEKAFLHAKAYIFSAADGSIGRTEGVIVGSSNLTGAGLVHNLELNLGRDDRPTLERATRWFDGLWEDAEPYDLAIVFEDALRPRTPWDIFIRVLWQLYGDEVEEDARIDGNLPLTSFQKHGVARALRLIRETGGAIVADEVGLGKTFVAGELLQIYREQRQRALLICPAALRDSTWRQFLTRFELFVECVSFEELANDVQLRDARRPNANQQKLQRPLGEYQFVVVDEAHNYRNPDAPTRAAALRRLLFGQRRDLLLLTATPVNNSLWDLFHLIGFFVRQDAHFADRGIVSIRQQFMAAMRADPANLNPDLLYPIIDATTVKRTREFVRRHYANDNITGPDGRPMPIVFPAPQAISVHYNLDEALPGFFDCIEAALDPESPDAIAFARYMPDAYLRVGAEAEEEARAQALVGLLRSGLLKRFESSVFAFRKTVNKMVGEHEAFLEALDAGYVVTTAFMQELSADDEAVFEEVLGATENRADAVLYDVERLRRAVDRDCELLQALADEAADIGPDDDPKLKALAHELREIALQAGNEATDGVDEAQKRKVLVFSFFEDTVEWIRDFLEAEFEGRQKLALYRDRMVVVSGSGDLGGVSRQQAVQGFAPISMEAPPGGDDDLYDILVSTDVLAEGVNLQQCRHIVNFDLPWNPMRLVQRHGRIDRIGSPHNRVFLRTIFPADRLDGLLNLEQRILDKLAMAAASVGVEAPIEGAARGRQVFTETREEIERLLREDATLYERGGPESAAQSGEEYRQTLRKALEADRDRIVGLPWKIGSGMMKGARRGVFFCAVVEKRTFLRFVPANEHWEVSGEAASVIREVGACLRAIECEPDTPVWFPDSLRKRVYDFWDVAQQDIWAEWMRNTDPINLQPKVRPLNHRVAAFIRDNPPSDMAAARIDEAIDILEAPWPRREETLLRGWFENPDHAGAALSRFLIEQIHETGLEAVKTPEPLPPIQRDDIELLCWMGVERADAAHPPQDAGDTRGGEARAARAKEEQADA